YVEDVDEYIEKCDVSIVPLFVGSGQRVKIIESFAKKIPVLSTSIGAEGLIYKNEKDIILADNAMEFIDSLEELRNHPEKLLRISESANMNFQQNYSADYLPDKLKKIMGKCKG
ncbi:glycosyltransferase family 4 protein, partial [Bacillus sp. Gnz1/2]|uniref:glycosyltransferase family 4 protein n=1 Tax=Bacillus sp. Gnz1/2 TaxID=3418490 RepID=UPI003CF37CF3